MSASENLILSGCILGLLGLVVVLSLYDSRRQAKAYSAALTSFRQEWVICDVSGVYVHKQAMLLMNQEFTWAAERRRRQDPEDRKLFVIVFDLDDFKKVNDRFGHLAGNCALGAFGAILRDNCRECDMVGRFGGDEFGVSGFGDESAAIQIAKRNIIALRNQIFRWSGKKVRLTVSIGIAMMTSTDTSVTQVIDRADKALYEVKRQGKNGIGIMTDDGIKVEKFA